ncbi:hypothetical protein BGW36DRAFT_427100 [Talaromyces proteolyticus]|uniref:Uncharacterized protein n=1 Tax=Talaromyces proteolyticus TaxID=1131652 RepID=A0AAD4Q0C2_9EURO|nr:uncharacterized protein BGW36DRAFT_427100 [Talaromyces proteolyticus]KAH8697126.1 hypothetical protein BGW36DRAFT_427100 [Talaromyces proteolyticus]
MAIPQAKIPGLFDMPIDSTYKLPGLEKSTSNGGLTIPPNREKSIREQGPRPSTVPNQSGLSEGGGAVLEQNQSTPIRINSKYQEEDISRVALSSTSTSTIADSLHTDTKDGRAKEPILGDNKESGTKTTTQHLNGACELDGIPDEKSGDELNSEPNSSPGDSWYYQQTTMKVNDPEIASKPSLPVHRVEEGQNASKQKRSFISFNWNINSNGGICTSQSA